MSGVEPSGATRAAEQAARQSYGRLVAYLARSWRDIATVEDALAESFARALEVWPVSGVPNNPDAWLLVTARNRLLDGARASKVRLDAVTTLMLTAELEAQEEEVLPVPDKRLELMFVCAHPAIDATLHTPLMLQTVLGLSAERIASSYLVSPDAMGRRLGRAKTRIRDIGLAFRLPDADELPGRTEAVLEAIYAAYGQGWDSIASDDASRRGLSEEAIWLARVLVSVAPDNGEAHGLLSLMLFCEARSRARRVDGGYVPFSEQDTRVWERTQIAAAETALRTAGALQMPGRFQLEAAIQSAMVQGRLTNTNLQGPLLQLHTSLVAMAPTIGNLVGRAAALAEVEGPEPALDALSALPLDKTRGYQPYWALRAHLLRQSGEREGEFRDALAKAIGLSEDPAVRRYLQTLST